ncbi:MAG TPA: hypothetical protein VNE21_00805, partial [Mycobacteriales bacterium]|nr:hypothetical protein [Mycobacteriales bacterium]
GCGAVMLAGIQGPDYAGQIFRTWLVRQAGYAVYDTAWYGGHVLLGYSLLFPILAAAVGTVTVGLLASVASAVLAARLVRGTGLRRSFAGVAWFSVGIAGNFLVGRFTFALGLAFGLAALLSLQHRRPWIALVAALLCGAGSPLAGLFLLTVPAALAAARRWRSGLPLLGATPGVLAAAVFGGGGRFPFLWTALLSVGALVGLGAAFSWRRWPVVRWWLLVYGAGALAAFVVPNAAGGNVARLGALVGGPLAACLLADRRRYRLLGVLAAPLLIWQLVPVVGAWAGSSGDPSAKPTYYTGLLAYLGAQAAPAGADGSSGLRVEIPPTRDHWEATYVAEHVLLARGWERQLDYGYNAVVYDPHLTAAELHGWLVGDAVSYVALPDAPLDPAAVPEAALLRAGDPWLRPVWHDRHWQVWKVLDPAPLVTGPATMSALGPESFVLRFARAGGSVVRLHYTALWRVVSGVACTEPTTQGWTRVVALQPGPVTIAASLHIGAGTACLLSP